MGNQHPEESGSWRDLLENATDPIWALDLEGNVTFLNSACETITGYTKQELLGRLGPMDEAHAEIRIVAKNGTPIDLEVNSSMLRREGRFVGILAIGRDVTERKKAEFEAQRAAREF